VIGIANERAPPGQVLERDDFDGRAVFVHPLEWRRCSSFWSNDKALTEKFSGSTTGSTGSTPIFIYFSLNMKYLKLKIMRALPVMPVLPVK
jgi:hypothetical protein